jgi:hypothetical protein
MQMISDLHLYKITANDVFKIINTSQSKYYKVV